MASITITIVGDMPREVVYEELLNAFCGAVLRYESMRQRLKAQDKRIRNLERTVLPSALLMDWGIDEQRGGQRP